MSKSVLRSLTAAAFVSAALATSAHAGPMVFSEALNFSTGTRSMWGPGKGTSSFGASDSASLRIPPFGPTVGGGYSASASSGTARSTLNGNFTAAYDDQLDGLGTTPIGLNFSGTSGSLSTSLGARFDVTGFVHDIPFYGPWDFCLYCATYSLDPSTSFTPVFGVRRSASDSFGVAGVGPDIGIAAAQLTLNANQTARITPHSLDGVMTYQHRKTGTTRSLPFSLSSLTVLDALLDRPGLWDFSFSSLDIRNTFNTSIGANLSLDVEVFGLLDESFSFANVNLLNTPSFDLNYATLAPIAGFSVQVPEPGTWLLLASGVLGLAHYGRRRED